jgi:hypothetical protein
VRPRARTEIPCVGTGRSHICLFGGRIVKSEDTRR